ncbi:uncharacterized protein Neto isoform X2 [Prorops nasuta]|uniref:uncharacterized protein Neto isoform X2 n=1 Tax=Prorops nasuta TaxID=863751 RepID=UPI0034CFFF37
MRCRRKCTDKKVIARRHSRIARFQFINVPEEERRMVARLTEQVLLLLILITEATVEDRWNGMVDNRRTNRSLDSVQSFDSPEDIDASRMSSEPVKTKSTTTDRSSLGTRLVLGYTESAKNEKDVAISRSSPEIPITTETPENEEARTLRHSTISVQKDSRDRLSSSVTATPSPQTRINPTEHPLVDLSEQFFSSSPLPKLATENSTLSNTNYKMNSSLEIGLSSIKLGIRSQRTLAELSTRIEEAKSTLVASYPHVANAQRRQMRSTADPCDSFTIGDDSKMEFYSPNYPDNYPNQTDCVKVLRADEGMLVKLDFRDEFKLEDSPECRFDYLEVRDGQYGYSNKLGAFCGTNFPPEITSKTRYLWLRFHSDDNIEGKGFKAVWSMVPRPNSTLGVPPEPEPCIKNVTGPQAIINSKDFEERKKLAEQEGLPLDCMWVIRVDTGWKIQLTFSEKFNLQRPNECEANFVDIFSERTDIPSREKNFCGSIADTVMSKSNLAYIRFYAEPKALNSSFEAIMTAIREKGNNDKYCREGEYDCDDATCISELLKCNGKVNCRFKWDEDETLCGAKKKRLMDSQHIVIILVVFSLIMCGMSFAFVFNCVRKLIRDHQIIQEHIRQSRENRLDELGRKSTPRPMSMSRTDIRERDSESPSLEVIPSKELLPPTTLIAQEYTKELVLEMSFNAKDIHDIHQSNNVSNATQERLQESSSSEEPEMRDSSCQTRESLFETRLPSDTMAAATPPTPPPSFTTFGFKHPAAVENGTNQHAHHRAHHHLPSPRKSLSSQKTWSSHTHHPGSQMSSRCSSCSPASHGLDTMGICPKHNPIPAPPGWSSRENSYSIHEVAQYPEQLLDYPTYQRFQSPKPSQESDVHQQSPKLQRQRMAGSGERYGSSLYGSRSSNTASSSPHSNTAKAQVPCTMDPRYRAEAVIEVDQQRRPFSIESTKSAPDVIATH